MHLSIFQDALRTRDGESIIGGAFRDVFLCRDTDGEYNEEMQDILQKYMVLMHTGGRMSLGGRAFQRAWD